MQPTDWSLSLFIICGFILCIIFFYYLSSRLGKKFKSAVQETGVSRHNGAPIKSPLLNPQNISAVMVQRGSKGLSIVPPCLPRHSKKTSIPFPFKSNGIRSWWQFSFRFWTKWNSVWFRKSEGKLSPRSYPIQYERKWNTSFLSALQPLGQLHGWSL